MALTAFAAVTVSVLAATKADPVLLTVNGKDIRLSEFEYLYHKSNSQQQEPQSVDEYLELFVNFKLKVADAEAAKLDTTKAFRDEFDEHRHRLAEPYLIDSAEVERMVGHAYSHLLEEVSVSHVMMTGDNAPRTLDSLRNVILSGTSTFEQVAHNYSVDPSATRNSGHLGFVPAGATPYLFEDAMYSTAVGEISPVIFSGVGYHIIRVDARRPAKGEVSASHILKLTRGLNEEQQAVARRQIDSIYALVKSGADFEDLARRESQDPGSARQGGSLGWFGSGRMVQPFDSIAFALADGEVSAPFATAFGYHIIKKNGHRGVQPLDSVRRMITAVFERDGRMQMARQHFSDSLRNVYGGNITAEAAIDRYIGELSQTNTDYRNLLNEYRDGILLFDISNTKVWEKAASDEVALENYFEANRSRYSWNKPRYKGYVLYATTDSVLALARQRIDAADQSISADSLARILRTEFGKVVKIERVLSARGDSPVVDYVAFGGSRPVAKRTWTAFSSFWGKVIDAPETVADVRGAVTSDYQSELEAQWIEELHRTYRVKINRKVLKKVKK